MLPRVLLAIMLTAVMLGAIPPIPQAQAVQSSTRQDSLSFDSLYRQVRATGPETTPLSLALASGWISGFATPATSNRTSIRKGNRVVEASGYSSTPDQTDDSPFITAKGTYVRDGIIATNFLPFGTVIKIPAIYGDKVFVVEDRMNTRYQNHIDIWFADRNSAIQFGRKRVTIEIL